jgi:leader peptidase (prepilin peptidase)/N-methyltransferase
VLPQSVWLVFAALLGAIVGSFLNVVRYRVPRGLSVVTPRSRCPWCGGEIAAYDNLPVVGYLLLRGRCRRCGGPIGWRYPAVEAGMAALFALIVLRFGPRPQALVAALLVALLAALAPDRRRPPRAARRPDLSRDGRGPAALRALGLSGSRSRSSDRSSRCSES